MKNLRDIKNKKQEKLMLETYKNGVIAEVWLKNPKNCKKMAEELEQFSAYSALISEQVGLFVSETVFDLQKSIIDKKPEAILENLNLFSSFFGLLKINGDSLNESLVPSLVLCNQEKVKNAIKIVNELSSEKRQSLKAMAPELPNFFLKEEEMNELILETGKLLILNENSIEQLQQMINGIGKLENIVKALPGFETTKAELAKFKSSIQNTASSRFGFSFSEETQIARISLVMEMFSKFAEAWPTVRKLFEKELTDASSIGMQNQQTQGGFVTQQNQEDNEEKLRNLTINATKTLVKAIKGTWFSRMSKIFKASKRGNLTNILKITYPGKLNPETLMADLVKVLSQPTNFTSKTVVNQSPRTQQIKEEFLLLETIDDLDKAMASFMSAMQSLNTQAQQTAAVAAAQEPAQQTNDPNQTQAQQGQVQQTQTQQGQGQTQQGQQTQTTITSPPDPANQDTKQKLIDIAKQFQDGKISGVQLSKMIKGLKIN